MSKISTAEQFLDKAGKGKGHLMLSTEEFTSVMKKFAKQHVKAALEAATKKVRQEYLVQGADKVTIDKSILSAYPENLII